ncbi:MAG: transposase family protein, partial [Psychromonas sp.]|nr:transposase family protein [Psychromonas sp.]
MISAVASAAGTWEQIKDFGSDKHIWLRKYRPFEKEIPTHDTIAR